MVRHTRPLTVVLFIYSLCAIANLGFQIYLFLVTVGNESCHQVLIEQQPVQQWLFWCYPIMRQIDLLVPLWAILWYFFATVVKRKRTNTVDYKNDDNTDTEPFFSTPQYTINSRFTGYSTSSGIMYK